MAKENTAIGIEYDSHEIRAVQLSKDSEGNYHVVSFGKHPVSESVLNGGMVNEGSLFTSALSELVSSSKINVTSPAVIGINNENVIMRYAAFPKVPDEKLKGVIMMQAQDFIPVPMSELGLDYVVIDESKDDDDQPVIDVLLVGARNVMIENIISNFEKSKFEIHDIDSSFLAWCRAAIAHEAEDEVFGFLKLTDDVLNFVAVDHGDIKMVRSMNIPDRASSEVKKAFNAPDDITDSQIEAVSDLLYSELISSINYFQMQNSTLINKVLFSAATPLEAKFLESISEKAFVPVIVPDLYGEFKTDAFEPSYYAGCISLAKVLLEG